MIVPIQQKALSEYRRKIDTLLRMSEDIASAAQQGDWKSALEKQRCRSEDLESFFSLDQNNLAQEVAELVASGIRSMLEIDAKVTELAYAGRDTLREEAQQSQKQTRAARAYLT